MAPRLFHPFFLSLSFSLLLLASLCPSSASQHKPPQPSQPQNQPLHDQEPQYEIIDPYFHFVPHYKGSPSSGWFSSRWNHRKGGDRGHHGKKGPFKKPPCKEHTSGGSQPAPPHSKQPPPHKVPRPSPPAYHRKSPPSPRKAPPHNGKPPQLSPHKPPPPPKAPHKTPLPYHNPPPKAPHKTPLPNHKPPKYPPPRPLPRPPPRRSVPPPKTAKPRPPAPKPRPPAPKPLPPPRYGGSSSSNKIAKQYLDPHNAARAAVGLPPMVWDNTVAKFAEWWANQRRLYGNCQMQHSDGPYGENLFWGIGIDFTPQDAVDAWVMEKQYYHYKTNTCDPNQKCGHYTQIVWRSAKKLGCAKVTCNSGDIFITCNYDPPGNYIGERPY